MVDDGRTARSELPEEWSIDAFSPIVRSTGNSLRMLIDTQEKTKKTWPVASTVKFPPKDAERLYRFSLLILLVCLFGFFSF